MANNNQLIVEVVGDTRKLKAGLADAQGQLRTFSTRTSTIRSTALDSTLAQVRNLRVEAAGLTQTAAQADAFSQQTEASFGRMAKGSLIAGLAINALGRNLAGAGGELGKFGKALSDLSSGNVVGFVTSLRDQSDAIKKFKQDLIDGRNATAATNKANQLAAAGFDELAQAARDAAAGIRQTTDAFSDVTKIRDSTSPGQIASEVSEIPIKRPQKRKGITAEQRNTFFDAGVARELDRVQDVKTVAGQVSALKAIGVEIQKRIDATKDITRKLNLEDQLAAVGRRSSSIQAQAGADAKADAAERVRLAKAAAAERKRIAAERKRQVNEAATLAAARRQARQSVALGDVTPGVQNLRKQLGTLTDRLADSGVTLGSKLRQSLEGARKILSGELGKATVESRQGIADLFDSIRSEFDGQQRKGPLTKTTSLNTGRIVDGLGLGRDQERQLRARLSHFNSAGVALAGAGGPLDVNFTSDVNFTIAIDGRPVEHSVTRNQQKRARANPPRRRGK